MNTRTYQPSRTSTAIWLVLPILLLLAIPLKGLGNSNSNNIDTPIPSQVSFVVAASNSNSIGKAQADYICDGIDDQVEIRTAINALPANGGMISLSEGTFPVFSHGVDLIELINNVSIEGMGTQTRIQLADGIDVDCSVFTATNKKDISIENLEIDGNSFNQNSGEMYGISFDTVSNSRIEVWSKDFRTANFNLLNTQDIDYQNLYWPVPDTKPSECQCFDSIAGQFPRNRVLLEDFESGWAMASGSSGNLGYDSAIRHQGDASLRITKPIGEDVVTVEKIINFDLSKKHPSIWVRIDEGVTSLYCTVFAQDESNRYKSNCFVRQDNPLVNTWYQMPIHMAAAEAISNLPDLSKVSKMSIEAKGPSSDSLSVWVDDICYYPAPAQGKVTLRFDDGHESVYTNALSVLARYSFSGVAGVVTSMISSVRNYMAVEQLKEMQETGWDIVSHSKYHDLDYNSPAGFVDDELRESQSFLIQNGFEKGSRFYISPRGSISSTIMKKIKNYYCMAIFSNNPTMNNAYPYHYLIGSRTVRQDTSPDTVKGWIDQAKEYGLWLVLVFHVIDESSNRLTYSPDDFTEVIDHLASVDIPVVTFSQVFDQYYLDSLPTQKDLAHMHTLRYILYPLRDIWTAYVLALEYYWESNGCILPKEIQ